MELLGVWNQCCCRPTKGVPCVLEAGYVKGRLTDSFSKDLGFDQARHVDILLPERA